MRSAWAARVLLATLAPLTLAAAAEKFPAAINPAPERADLGPQTFTTELTERSPSFDVYVEGSGDVRVYFDIQNESDFHFLVRKGSGLTLGASEAGVEETFATAKVDGNEALRIARRGAHVAIFQGNKLLTMAFDDRFPGGRAGFRMLSGGAPVGLKMEARDEIHFSDDFMIAEGQPSQWRGNGNEKSGDFRVRSLRHPAMSANAFNYMGAGAGIYSVVGQPWWDRYRYRASLRGPYAGKIGLIFAFVDEKNYGLFRWTARTPSSTGKITGVRQLIRVRDGKESVLASEEGGYTPDLWYRATIDLTYAGVSVAVDGHELIAANDPYLKTGGAGVWCDVPLPTKPAVDPKAQPYEENDLHDLMKQHAVFDDVAIESLKGFEDDFTIPGELRAGWHTGTSEWRVENGSAQTISDSRSLIGSPRWSEYQVSANVWAEKNESAGVVLLHRDESNYYSALVNSTELTLVRVSAGKVSVLDKAPVATLWPATPMPLTANIRKGHILVSCGGATVETFEPDASLRGRVGLISQGTGLARFGRFRVAFPPEARSLVTVNAIFDREASMQDWASPTSEWFPPMPKTIDGRPVTLMWHRSQFPGDVELMIEPHAITDADYEVAVSIAKGGEGKDNGYVFRLRGEADGTRRLHLIRNGQKMTDKTIWGTGDNLTSIAIRRCGKYITGIVNGRPALVYRDESPLSGGRVAFYTQNISVHAEAVKITNEHCHNDVFTTAPVDWRTAGFAIAEVANRWQCSPNWSFFSLKNERSRGKPAVLWSKHLYPGDATVEFYVAHKMERERGEPYVYARDINVTICSDGQDLTKGYTFMWGGHNNAGSMILRNGVEVKHNIATIPTDHGNSRVPETDWHHHWFAVRVEKRGSRVTFRVDRFFSNEPDEEMSFEDPEPLSGSHIAIWTYDHCILISRARLSGQGGTELEHPDWIPGALKTPYDGAEGDR